LFIYYDGAILNLILFSSIRQSRSSHRGKESTLKSKSELEMIQNALSDDNVFSDDEGT